MLVTWYSQWWPGLGRRRWLWGNANALPTLAMSQMCDMLGKGMGRLALLRRCSQTYGNGLANGSWMGNAKFWLLTRIAVSAAHQRYSNNGVFFQIWTICTKICSSPQHRSSFRRIAKRVCGGKKAPEALDPLKKHGDIGMLMVLRDVVTRWNSTQAMLRRSLILQDVSVGDFFVSGSSYSARQSRNGFGRMIS